MFGKESGVGLVSGGLVAVAVGLCPNEMVASARKHRNRNALIAENFAAFIRLSTLKRSVSPCASGLDCAGAPAFPVAD